MLSDTRPISTIIATHNRPGFVVKTLDCLLQQTRKPREVIVIDDGSQAPTGEAIETWRRERRPGFSLIYLWQPNSGPAVARNRGVALSSGDLVHFIDDDDVMHPGALAALAAALEGDGPAIAMASYQNRWQDGTAGHLIEPPRLGRAERLAAMIGGAWFVPVHGYLFTREAVHAIGGWNTALTSQEDDEYLLRAAALPIEFVRAPAALVYYCQHAGVRRATPGKPGESVTKGREKRLYADLAIREAAYARLRNAGLAGKYRHAFQAWQARLYERYGDFLDEPPPSALLDWLADAGASEIVVAPHAPAVGKAQKPVGFRSTRVALRAGAHGRAPASSRLPPLRR